MQFCEVSAMTDQLPKPTIGDKSFFSSMNLERHEPQWFDRCSWLHYKEDKDCSTLPGSYLCNRLPCSILHVTCLEWTGFTNLKDAVVNFTFHARKGCARVVSLHNVKWRQIAFLCVTLVNGVYMHVYTHLLQWRIFTCIYTCKEGPSIHAELKNLGTQRLSHAGIIYALW